MLIILLNVSLYRKGKIQVNIKWRTYKLLKNKGLCADTICFISPILFFFFFYFCEFLLSLFFLFFLLLTSCFLNILQFTSYFSLLDFPVHIHLLRSLFFSEIYFGLHTLVIVCLKKRISCKGEIIFFF